MPDDEHDEEWLKDSAEEFRADAARERAERVAGRRLLLQCVPGDLRDLDAAAECECSCHPQPGRPATHPGEMCVCQLSAAELEARRDRGKVALGQLREMFKPVQEQHARELAEAAERLQVQVQQILPGAPWVLVGAVDGRRFSLRERWGEWTLTIAPADDPDLDPWGAPESAAAITIASGSDTDLYIGTPPDYGKAVTFVVATIRAYLRRQTCPHPHSAADRYCPACGIPLVDEAAP